MEKNLNLCVDLKTVMQNDALLVEGQCYNGVLTRDCEDHYVFEESINTMWKSQKLSLKRNFFKEFLSP